MNLALFTVRERTLGEGVQTALYSLEGEAGEGPRSGLALMKRMATSNSRSPWWETEGVEGGGACPASAPIMSSSAGSVDCILAAPTEACGSREGGLWRMNWHRRRA